MEADIEMAEPSTNPSNTTDTRLQTHSRSSSYSIQPSMLETLPEEVFGDLFSFLPFSFVVRSLSLINRKWYHLVYSQVHCASFKSKEINRESGISDVVAAIQRFRSLAELTLVDFEEGIEEGHAKGILTQCGTTLRKLVIQNSLSLSSIDLSDCTALRHVSFTGCEKLAKIQVNDTCCQRLESIDLSSTKITDENLRTILSFVTPRRLKNVTLFDCNELKYFPAFAEILDLKETNPNSALTPMSQIGSSEELSFGLPISRSDALSPSASTDSVPMASTPTRQMARCASGTPIKSTSMFRLEKLDLSYCFKLRIPHQQLSSEENHTTSTSRPDLNSLLHNSNNSNGDDSALAIEDLVLRRTLINDDQFQELTQMIRFNRLKSLNIYGCLHLRSPRFSSRSLRTLDMSHTRIEDDSLRFVVFNCPNLSVLKLFNCRELHSPVVENDNLTTLDLGFCVNLTYPQITCHALEDLSMRNTDISDEVLEKVLAHSSSRLRILTLSQCNSIENPEISCGSLETLSMNACEGLSRPVLTNCASLKSLNISETKITDAGLECILSGPGLTSLQTVDIRWCTNIKNAKIPPNVVVKRG